MSKAVIDLSQLRQQFEAMAVDEQQRISDATNIGFRTLQGIMSNLIKPSKNQLNKLAAVMN